MSLTTSYEPTAGSKKLSRPSVNRLSLRVAAMHLGWNNWIRSTGPPFLAPFLFERLAIDVLRETDIQGATRILRISWDEAWHIMERAVRRGQRRKKNRNIKYLGVDETAARKGAKYLTLVCDLKRSSVEHVAEDRQIGSLGGYLEGLSRRHLHGIEAIAMDMWNPYEQAVLAHVPNGAEKIVFDKFHIVRHMNRAVDMVRKREHRKLRSEGDETLKGSKYLWLWGQENVPEKHRERFEDLKTMHLKTGRAWALKEALRQLWNYTTRGWAMRFWNKWYWWATHSRLKPVIEVARMIKRRLRNVMTYFRHPITSATSESINSNVQAVKRMARGFRNLDHFKTAIFFHCGKLDLYPVTHGIPG